VEKNYIKEWQMKKIIVLSDMHCGSKVGLTPPSYQYELVRGDKNKHNKFSMAQKAGWDWFINEIKKLGKIDLCLVLGDCIDGQGRKDNGVDQITTDLEEQCQMAIECLQYVKAKKYHFVYGTNYHITAAGQDFENIIARTMAGKIGNHEFVDVNGLVFNLKHKVSRSSIPHGRATPLKKAKLWELIYKDYKNFPNSDILLRGHCHYFDYSGDAKYLMAVCPCLKMLGERYGARNFDDAIDYGFLVFEIEDKKHWKWYHIIAEFPELIPEVKKY
jgi:hypothetical protein